MTKSSLITFRRAGSYALNISNRALDDIQRFFESKGVTEGTFDVFRGNNLRGNVGVVLRPYDGGNAISLNCRTRDDEFPCSYKIQPIGLDVAAIDAKLRQENVETSIRLNISRSKLASPTCQKITFSSLWREKSNSLNAIKSLIRSHTDERGQISESDVLTALELVYHDSTGIKANPELLSGGIESLRGKGIIEPFLNGHAGSDIQAAIRSARLGGTMRYVVSKSNTGASSTSSLSAVDEDEFVESAPPSFLAKTTTPKASVKTKNRPIHQPLAKRSQSVKLTGKWNLRTIGAFNAFLDLQVGYEATKEVVKEMIGKVWLWAEGKELDETELSYSLRMLVRTGTIQPSKWNEAKAPTHYKVTAIYNQPEDFENSAPEMAATIVAPPIQSKANTIDVDINGLANEALELIRNLATPDGERGVHTMRSFAGSIETIMKNHGINPEDMTTLDKIIARLCNMRVVEEKYAPNYTGQRRVQNGWYVYNSPQTKVIDSGVVTKSARVIPADKQVEYTKSKTRIDQINDEMSEIGGQREADIEELRSQLELDIQRVENTANAKMKRLKEERDALNQVVSGIEALARLG